MLVSAPLRPPGRRLSRLLLGLLFAPGLSLLGVLPGCEASDVPSGRGGDPSSTASTPFGGALRQNAASLAGARLIDQAADGRRLLGKTLRPAVPGTEQGEQLSLTLVDAAGQTKLLALPAAVHGALGPRGLVAAVDAAGGLWLVDGDRAPEKLDDQVGIAVAFSHDGTRLAYARRTPESRKTGVFEGDLFIVRLDGRPPRAPQRVLDRAPLGGLTNPAFAEDDGSLFAVGVDERSSLAQIVAIDLARRQLWPLTNVGLVRREGQAPSGFVPLPLGPLPMEHRGGLLFYFSGDADVSLDPQSGRAEVRPRQQVRP